MLGVYKEVQVKVSREFFEAVVERRLTCKIQKDINWQVEDQLRLVEVTNNKKLTGRSIYVKVTHIQRSTLLEDNVLLSFVLLKKQMSYI